MADNLTLDDSDLYYNGRVIVFNNGDKLLQRDIISYPATQPDIYHTVQAGDTCSYIAWLYYQNFTDRPSRYWKYIADANNIHNPLDLIEYIGKRLLIPDFNLIKLSE